MTQVPNKRAAGRDDMFGRYRLRGRLAAGGMAEVWAAQLLAQGGFCKPMVIKRVLPELAENPTFLKMLMTEARVAARLSHANICAVFELGEVEGEYYIAMEYLRGTPLSSVLRAGGGLSPALAVSIITQACEGLHYAHEQRDAGGNLLGLVHRDVSPHNLFVTVDGIVKVLDFGIAKVDDGISERTEEGKVKGKLTYMSPEQLAAMPLDRRSDVWSLAVVLWEMLAGRRLFGGGGPAAAVDGIRNGKVPALATVGVIAPKLDQVLVRALTPDRDHRIGTAAELKRALCEAIAPLPPAPSEEIAHLVWERCGSEVRTNDRRFEDDDDGAAHNLSAVLERLPLRAEETQPSVPSLERMVAMAGGEAEPGRSTTALPTSEDWGPGIRLADAAPAAVDTSPEIEVVQSVDPATGSVSGPVPSLRPGGGRMLVVGVMLAAAAAGAAAVFLLRDDKTPAPPPVAAPLTPSEPPPLTPREPPPLTPSEPPSGESRGDVAVDVAPAEVERPAIDKPAIDKPAIDKPILRHTKPAIVRPPPPPPPPPARPGKVTLDARPYATIYLDGRKIGITPIVGLSVPAGDHTVKAVAEDGQTRTMRLHVDPGGEVRRKVVW